VIRIVLEVLDHVRLNDTIFVFVRSGYDALCLDRCEGPFPIRSFTNDVGGRVALGVGQAAMVLLAYLPEAERDEVIRFNVPRLRDLGVYDEVYLRAEIDRVRAQGYCSRETGVIPGMTGAVLPVFDRTLRRPAQALASGAGTLAG
jgi:DNA-binding IclR family transcriptional regulator